MKLISEKKPGKCENVYVFAIDLFLRVVKV